MSSRLVQRGFISLIVTQFFGAANDNILKGVLTFGVAAGGFWAASLGTGGQAIVMWCLTLPFILLSGYAGQIADRISKQKLTVIVKFAEILIGLVVLIGFWTGQLWVCIGAMILLAVQSTFFGPAKYGMIPELVDEGDLSRANGAINMLTNIAIIIGTLLAGPVYDAFHPPQPPPVDPNVPPPDPRTLPGRAPWAPGVAVLIVAVLGVLVALTMPRLRAQVPNLKFDLNPVGTYWRAIREMAKGPLFLVALSWSFFYFIGAIAILVLPDYKALLNITATKASYLLGTLGIAIGIGSVAAGLISGREIKPRLVPVGAIGMTVFFALLGILPQSYGFVMAMLLGAGIFAGFYIIPLQSLLQKLSPDSERGRFLATANAMSFACSSLGSAVFFLARQWMPANRVFIVCAVCASVGSAILMFVARDELRKS